MNPGFSRDNLYFLLLAYAQKNDFYVHMLSLILIKNKVLHIFSRCLDLIVWVRLPNNQIINIIQI